MYIWIDIHRDHIVARPTDGADQTKGAHSAGAVAGARLSLCAPRFVLQPPLRAALPPTLCQGQCGGRRRRPAHGDYTLLSGQFTK